jgi:hypothetical protein
VVEGFIKKTIPMLGVGGDGFGGLTSAGGDREKYKSYRELHRVQI